MTEEQEHEEKGQETGDDQGDEVTAAPSDGEDAEAEAMGAEQGE